MLCNKLNVFIHKGLPSTYYTFMNLFLSTQKPEVKFLLCLMINNVSNNTGFLETNHDEKLAGRSSLMHKTWAELSVWRTFLSSISFLRLRGAVSVTTLAATWEVVCKGFIMMAQAVGTADEFLLSRMVTVDSPNVPLGHRCYMIARRPDLTH